ncbi:hypothetical protein CspeluHIS016_0210760 [Cutaneotrichosporon spelunceum]|uniref:Glutamyl-tRNA synthetase n=1 Tax=Cutaneotrichosporon spelunceum TaxID=1672016 RepID=A0AAD3TT90_9TREE|nr:hypothetical protein CspeluHIS016_0210760 [Cutaneotrichosporon spelunceum]
MAAIPTDSPKTAATRNLQFALSRAPRFDVVAPIVWKAWHDDSSKRHPPVSVTWVPEDAGLLKHMESTAPWDELFGAHPELEHLYCADFWGIDALYPEIMAKVERLDQRLTYRTALLGPDEGDSTIGLADVLLWGVIRAKNKVENERRRRRSSGGGLDAILPVPKDGKVVVRFECSSTTFLHVGQLKELLVNRHFADKYDGRLILRFEDLRPISEEGEFVDDIIADLGAIGISFDHAVRSTDHLEATINFARQLIRKGDAYMDYTPWEQAGNDELSRTPNPHRNTSVDINLQRFHTMLTGSEDGEGWVLRARIDPLAESHALRDPIIFQCFKPRTSDKTSVEEAYPTHGFASPILDHLDGVTHVLRSVEQQDQREQYRWLADRLGFPQIVLCHLPHLNIECGSTSKVEVQHLAQRGLVRGWDDPRVASVRGLLARGMTPEALKKHILTLSDLVMDAHLSWDELWYANRRAIDHVVPRYWAISDPATSVVARVEGINRVSTGSKPLNKLNAEVGTKLMVYTTHIHLEHVDAASLVEGEEITLMDFATAVVTSVVKSPSPQGMAVKGLTLRLNPHGNPKQTSKRFHWLPAATPTVVLGGSLTPVVLVKYPRPSDIESSEVRTQALASPQVSQMKKGEILQFERKGFYICHGYAREGGLEFTAIPEGRSPRRRSSSSPISSGSPTLA